MGVERLHDLLARLHAHPRRRLTLMVAVDGPGAPGGSAFTAALSRLDPELVVVGVDAFRGPARPEPRPAPEPGPGYQAAIDWRRLRDQLLLPLARNQRARFQAYDRAAGRPLGWREVAPGGIVMVEGAHSWAPQLAGFYDFRIWVLAPRPLPLGRGLRIGLGQSVEPAQMPSADTSWRADLVIDGSGHPPHDPLREYVRVRTGVQETVLDWTGAGTPPARRPRARRQGGVSPTDRP